MKAAIAYWSGTGNTEAMAESFKSNLEAVGAQVEFVHVASGTIDPADYDIVLLGCPAMGAEELESDEFEPFLSSIEAGLSGKKVVLFGSYDWGTGDWMEAFKERVANDGADILDAIIANNAPDDECFSKIASLCKGLS